MRSFISNYLLNPVVLLCLGAVFALIGAFVAADIPAARRRLISVEQLQPGRRA